MWKPGKRKEDLGNNIKDINKRGSIFWGIGNVLPGGSTISPPFGDGNMGTTKSHVLGPRWVTYTQ